MVMKILAAIAVFLVLIVVANKLVRTFRSKQNTVSAASASGTLRLVEARVAARRAFCLASIGARANLEYQLHFEPSPSTEGDGDADFLANQRKWMKGEGLWDALSPRERTLLEKPLGGWSNQEMADGQWRQEALAVLLWALQPAGELPEYDRQAFTTGIMDSLPPPSAIAKFTARAKLRDGSEITNGRDIAELWLWRARTTQLQLSHGTPPKGLTFEVLIAMTAKKAEQDRLFVAISNDFPAFKKAYSQLSDDEWNTMRSIAQERLYAFNWLCRYAEDWDAVPTDT
jgi:Domain of unknown function (DUF4272)